jgi:hypothetical protein
LKNSALPSGRADHVSAGIVSMISLSSNVHHRPAQSTRGYYRVTLRHGVSRLRSGERYTLGVIFHDAE